MAARENILARIRARQGKPETPAAEEREAVRAHLAAHPLSARPRMDWEPVARFRERALGLASTLEEVDSLEAAPAAVARYLRAGSLPLLAVCWPAFEALDWRSAGVEIAVREARESDLVGITGAYCAIAETGTLMTVTGPRTPAAVSLLPETHVAIVPASRIVRGMEEAWQLLREELKLIADGGTVPAGFAGRRDPGAIIRATSTDVLPSAGQASGENAGRAPVALPRAVNFISGPSRTADIEQTVTLGAHGPYRVHIVLIRS